MYPGRTPEGYNLALFDGRSYVEEGVFMGLEGGNMNRTAPVPASARLNHPAGKTGREKLRWLSFRYIYSRSLHEISHDVQLVLLPTPCIAEPPENIFDQRTEFHRNIEFPAKFDCQVHVLDSQVCGGVYILPSQE